jgi:hypothetical protein
MHEAPGGKTRQLASQKARDFGLVDFQSPGGLSLREPLRANRFANPNSKVGLREAFFGVGETNIGEYVAAAFPNLNSIAHARYSF